jgi:mannosyltransferase
MNLKMDKDKYLASGIVMILIANGMLAMHSIPQTGFWLDELYSFYYASLDMKSLLHIETSYEANMALYYNILHTWLVAGSSEIYIKALSVLFGLATIVVIYNIGIIVHSPKVGLYAALLLTVNPFFLYYEQEARSYSLTVFLTSLAAFSFFKLLMGEDSWKNKLLFIFTSILSLYSHMFAALVLVALYGSLILKPKQAFSRHMMVPALAIMVGALPLIWFVATKRAGQLNWVHPSRLNSIVQLLYAFVSGSQGGGWLSRISLALLLVPCSVTVKRWLSTSDQSEDRSFLVSLCSWLWVPILLCYGVSFWKPLFVPRFLIVSLPPLMLITAIGLAEMSYVVLRRTLSISIVTIMLISVSATHHHRAEDWRGLYEVLGPRCSSSAFIIFQPHVLRVSYPYFSRQYASLKECQSRILPLPINSDSIIQRHSDFLAKDLLPPQGPYQVWLILGHDEQPPWLAQRSLELQRELESRAEKKGYWEFTGNLRLVLYEKSP